MNMRAIPAKWLGAALCSCVAFHASAAAADNTVYAEIYLTNNSNQPIFIPADSGSLQTSVWGTIDDTLTVFGPYYEVMPDGSPPGILCPGQTMMFGSKSDGGLAPDGTAGQLSFSLPGGQTAHMFWSAPWAAFNVDVGCINSGSGMDNPAGFPPAAPYTIAGGIDCDSVFGKHPNIATFVFEIGGGPTNAIKCPVMMPTGCPAGMQCSTQQPMVTSPDGSTTLAVVPDPSFGGSASAWGGALKLTGPNGATWLAPATGVAAAVMGDDGNFVAYGADGSALWSSNTGGNWGAVLEVGASTVSVALQAITCFPIGRIWHCGTVDDILWSATATPPVLQ